MGLAIELNLLALVFYWVLSSRRWSVFRSEELLTRFFCRMPLLSHMYKILVSSRLYTVLQILWEVLKQNMEGEGEALRRIAPLHDSHEHGATSASKRARGRRCIGNS
jgi:hypothetical protein